MVLLIVKDLFDVKCNGVIEFEEFTHFLNILHLSAPESEKISCEKALVLHKCSLS